MFIPLEWLALLGAVGLTCGVGIAGYEVGARRVCCYYCRNRHGRRR